MALKEFTLLCKLYVHFNWMTGKDRAAMNYLAAQLLRGTQAKIQHYRKHRFICDTNIFVGTLNQ
jgi:hypothetical protein